MEDLFAKKNKKKKGKKGKVDLNKQLNSGAAMDVEDPTERIQRLKIEAAVKDSITKQTTDSDWSDSQAETKKKVINTSGRKIADMG